jgi:hypothetical protein
MKFNSICYWLLSPVLLLLGAVYMIVLELTDFAEGEL